MKEKEDTLEISLLLFYLLLSLFTFLIYLSKHPIVELALNPTKNNLDLFYIYTTDLIIFLILLTPYLILTIALILIRLIKKINMYDGFYIMLFFPLISFFMKGMALLKIYSTLSLLEILKANLAFFIFPLIGPVIVLFINIVKRLKISINKREDYGK